MDEDNELELNGHDADLEEELDSDAEEGTDSEKESDKKTYDDKEVDNIVKKKIARLEKKHQRELEQAQRSSQSDDLSEVERLQQKLDEFERNDTRRALESDVRNVFKDADIDAPDSLVSALIRDDEDETQDVAEAVLDFVRQEVQKVKKLQGRRKPPADPDASKPAKKTNMGERLASRTAAKNGKAFE